jgi:hypothetical protein
MARLGKGNRSAAWGTICRSQPLASSGNIEAAAPALIEIADMEHFDAALRSRVDILVKTASYRSSRGATCVAVIADELAFWRVEGSTNPDTEILRALRPSLLTTKGPMIAISSPYARRGELWKAYSKHFGKTGDPILVAQAPSWQMNTTLDRLD